MYAQKEEWPSGRRHISRKDASQKWDREHVPHQIKSLTNRRIG